jgi:hypothetical protein
LAIPKTRILQYIQLKGKGSLQISLTVIFYLQKLYNPALQAMIVPKTPPYVELNYFRLKAVACKTDFKPAKAKKIRSTKSETISNAQNTNSQNRNTSGDETLF